MELAIAAAVVATATLPFAWRYVLMQRQLRFDRSLDEVVRFSATLDHYRAALPGFTVPLLLAAAAIADGVAARFRGRPTLPFPVLAVGAGALLTFWLSLGPVVHGGGQALPVPGLYALLYNYAAGFRGIRAVARYAMLFFFFLAVLAGCGIAAIERRSHGAARVVALIACAIFLWQTRPSPFPLDREWPFVTAGLAPVPSYLRPEPASPAVYRFVSTLEPDAVLVEFPFGDNAYDLRYMYFSSMHRKRMLGGFSGVFPDSWLSRRAVLEHPLAHDEEAWRALDGATHAIVHSRAWPDATGARIAGWLRAHGAREAAAFDDAHVFELRR
jgi:hypothetical protein